MGTLPIARRAAKKFQMNGRDIDIAILGGGLAGGLIALALAEKRPDISVLLVESGETFGGNHVWSFFESDIAPEHCWLLEPLISARWDGYCVHFPSHSRTLTTSYRSITSDRLDEALRSSLPAEALLNGAEVMFATHNGFTLADGRSFTAGGVMDARGAAALPHLQGGWQKFAGQMLRLEAPHGLDRPIVMDARVEQFDGYRFIYCLPFSANEVFVEDTYYSDDAVLDVPTLRSRIAHYSKNQGWQISRVSREETGVLPVIAGGDFDAFWAHGGSVARAGTRAALIHPLTSYSLPDAVRFAQHIAGLENVSGAALAEAGYAWARRHWRHGRYYRMLARLLFGAAQPLERYRILERFYRLPETLIERFYAGRSTPADFLRILSGKPPVPVGEAITALTGHGAPLAALGEEA